MIKVKGAEEAARLLEELAEAIATGRIGGEHFRLAMEQALRLATSRTPVKTGWLASNNRLQFTGWNSATLSNATPYASYVHDGTSKMEPRPFLREAMEMARAQYPALYYSHAQEFLQQLYSKHRPR